VILPSNVRQKELLDYIGARRDVRHSRRGASNSYVRHGGRAAGDSYSHNNRCSDVRCGERLVGGHIYRLKIKRCVDGQVR
jgi:hypothetical protein